MANTLINLQSFKAGVDAKLGAKRKFAQFVDTEVSDDLQVQTVNVVTNNYVGDATVVAPGAKIPVSNLVQTNTPVTFEKIAKGVKITDEEARQKFGDALGNAEVQTAQAIDSKMEAKVADLVKTATFSVQATTVNAEAVLDAIVAMGEAFEDAPVFLLVNPADLKTLQADIKPSDKTELQGTIYGVGIIVTTRIDAGTAVLIQEGAIKEYVQKDTEVEVARIAGEKATEVYTDKIHAVFIQDHSKLVYIAKKA